MSYARESSFPVPVLALYDFAQYMVRKINSNSLLFIW